MLYDPHGREIPEARGSDGKAIGARLVHWEDIDRHQDDESRALTPTKLDRIFREANGGDSSAQARLALEIEEKDWDSAQALGTRRAAVEGIAVSVVPGDEDDARQADIAAAADEVLSAVEPVGDVDVSFDGLINHLLSGILPGYSWAEILWGPGGKTIEAFAPGIASAITYNRSQEPLIETTKTPTGVPMLPNKFVFHRHRARSGDATRGGLIRPLGWMYLFANLGMKDLLRFVEKFGMPFVSARVDENAWEKDRTKIAYLIRNFGSDGGGVFSKSVELEMLQSGTSQGECYFKLLDYFGSAKAKVILGQTATSGDAGGFSKGQAQENVRQDILEADCKAIARTIRSDILRPWVMFNYGADAPVPFVKFAYEPPEDRKYEAEIIEILSNAGYQVDIDHIQKTLGMPVTATPAGLRGSDAALTGEKKKSASARGRSLQMTRW